MADILHTGELEKSVIGALCAEPRLIGRIGAVLSPNDFSVDTCRDAFKAALRAHSETRPFDPLIAADALATKMGSDHATEFIKQCLIATPTTANAEYYATLLHERATARRLSAALLDDLMATQYGSGTDLAASIMQRCREFLERESTGRMKTMLDAVSNVY